MKHLKNFENFESAVNESLINNLKNAFIGLLMTVSALGGKAQNIDSLMKDPNFSENYHKVQELVCQKGYSEEAAKEVIDWITAEKLMNVKLSELSNKYESGRISQSQYDSQRNSILRDFTLENNEETMKSIDGANQLLKDLKGWEEWGIKVMPEHELMSTPTRETGVERLAPDFRRNESRRYRG